MQCAKAEAIKSGVANYTSYFKLASEVVAKFSN